MNYMLKDEILSVYRLIKDTKDYDKVDASIVFDNFKNTLERKKHDLEYDLKQVEDSLAVLSLLKNELNIK